MKFDSEGEDIETFEVKKNNIVTKNLKNEQKKKDKLYKKRRDSDVPQGEGYQRIELKSNDYLKLYWQKGSIHEGDWENARSISNNLDYDSIKKIYNIYPFNRIQKTEPDLDLGINGLLTLGQIPLTEL